MKELQAAVAAWGNSAFPRADLSDLFKKLQEEVEELRKAALYPFLAQEGDEARECADVQVVLFRIASKLSVQVDDAVREKMPLVVAKHGGTWQEPE